jgi:hypothetical protein
LLLDNHLLATARPRILEKRIEVNGRNPAQGPLNS